MPLLRAAAILGLLAAFYAAAAMLQFAGARAGELADRLAVAFCRSMLFLLGVRHRQEGTPASPALIVANHVSWIDILILGSRRRTCFLAKAEVGRWPVIGRFARLKGTVFVERRRRRSILPANAQITARLQDGLSVVVFPEGTTSAGPGTERFGPSHLEPLLTAHRHGTRVVLQPVALAYDWPGAAWIGDGSLLPHLWSVLRQTPITCTSAFATPLEAGTSTSRAQLARAARALVEADLTRVRGASAFPRSRAGEGGRSAATAFTSSAVARRRAG